MSWRFCHQCGDRAFFDIGYEEDEVHWIYPYDPDLPPVRCGRYIASTWWRRALFNFTTYLIKLVCGRSYGKPHLR
jgi:hypothetical protein